ncbi:MAG: replication and repair protein RecF [Candidatus Cloacimonadota bacterium]|nr:replication and repair protein RecF [Candidatus Cloacimonadota bacterium]
MKLNSIELRNFRSYKERCFEFAPPGNLIIGDNGSGKTNLLEAIAYTSIGKSIRYHSDQDLITTEQDFFAIEAYYDTDLQSKLKIQLSYSPSHKLLKINDQISRQLSTLLQEVKVIYCAPDDIQLVNGSPRIRRQYFDLAISQIFPQYLTALREYLHLVEQRNRLLKTDFQPAEKNSWDQRFAAALAALYPYRQKYLSMLNSEFAESFRAISAGIKDISLTYQPVLKNAFEQSQTAILNSIRAIENKEVLWQRSLIGAHLDDYSLEMEGRSMHSFASQGQKRIAVIVLKLIQAKLIQEYTAIKPVLLFDDVFAELDLEHSNRIRKLSFDAAQIFIASPKNDICGIWAELPIIRLGKLG